MSENSLSDAAAQKRAARRKVYRMWPVLVLVGGWCLLQIAGAIKIQTVSGGARGNLHDVTLEHEPVLFWFSLMMYLLGLLLCTAGPLYMIWDDRRDRSSKSTPTGGPPSSVQSR
jgi:hypothetical protein